MAQTLRIGTRGSPLALVQARLAATALRDAHGWSADRIDIVEIATTGDMVRDRPLAEIGGKALWTREIDRALMTGLIDVAVHSMKDVETIRPEALAIAAILPRADVRDRLVGAATIESLANGARFGTSSPRRAAQLLARRPDLAIVPLRGNVETRLRKIGLGEADATLLASAGLDRLGYGELGTPLDDLLPAPAQGAVGIEARAGDRRTLALVAAIDDPDSHACVAAERRLLAALGGGCHSPVAALARLEGGAIRLRAEILSPAGREVQAGEIRFERNDRERPAELAATLLGAAGPALRRLFAE